MTETTLHFAPEGKEDPYPVSMSRVKAALAKLQPQPDLSCVADEGGTVQVGDRTYSISFFGRRDYLSVRSNWDPNPQSSARSLFRAVNSWNRFRHFPTAYVDRKKDDSFTVVADMVIHCRHGLSDLQLDEEVVHALPCCAQAIDYVQWAYEQMQSDQ